MLSGEQVPQWTREDIMNYTDPKFGYTRDTPGFQKFVNVLVSMSGDERKVRIFHRFVLFRGFSCHLIRSFVCLLLVCSFVFLFAYLFVFRSFVRSFVRLFVRVLVLSFVCSFGRSFVGSSVRLVTPCQSVLLVSFSFLIEETLLFRSNPIRTLQ